MAKKAIRALGGKKATPRPRATASTARKAIRLYRAIEAVPTTWLDPILSGPSAVVGMPPYGCPDVERILNAVRDRIAGL